jgi:hypothetical protein
MVLGSAVNYRCMAFAVDNAFLFSQLVTLEFALSHAYIDSFPSMTDPRGSEQSDSAASSSGCRKRAKSRYPASGAPEKEKRKLISAWTELTGSSFS